MEGEVDSLEHIKALMNSDEHQTNGSLEEPGYQLVPKAGIHINSFGAGGRTSQIVDPSFRVPVTQSEPTISQEPGHREHTKNADDPNISVPPETSRQPAQAIQTLAPSSSNPSTAAYEISGLVTSYNGSNDTPIFGMGTNSSIPFSNSMSTPKADFSSVARLPVPPIAESSIQITSTYSHNEPSAFTNSDFTIQPSNVFTDRASLLHSSKPDRSQNLANNGQSGSGAEAQTSKSKSKTPFLTSSEIILPLSPPPPPLPRYEKDNRHGRIFLPGARNTDEGHLPSSNHDSSLLYSPPPPGSPPLNRPSNYSATHFIKPTSIPNAPLGRIPKKHVAEHVDRLDEMGMLELIERHEEQKSRLTYELRRRSDIERALNDITRKSQGRIVEMDPTFIQLKSDQRLCNEKVSDIKCQMNRVSDKLLTKFNRRVTDNDTRNTGVSSLPYRQRARMSTSSRTEPDPLPVSKPANDRRKSLLELKSDNYWCKACDIHVDSIKKFCQHLHTLDHLHSMKTSEAPWSRSKDTSSKKETYNTLKSICALVSNEKDKSFSLESYEKTLTPNFNDKAKKLKDLFIQRERGNFQDDDPLFSVKGYQNLIPITGYFCQLCDRAYCDSDAIEQHLKSYEHNYKHAITVATDPISEGTFKAQQERSFKKHSDNQEAKQISSSLSSGAGTFNPSQTIGSSSSRAPVQQYKKATSIIVDSHDSIAGMFPKRAAPEEPHQNSTKSDDKQRNSGKVPRPSAYALLAQRRKRSRLLSDSEVDDNEADVNFDARASVFKVKLPKKVFRKDVQPEIVPLGEIRSKPAALKRLKSTSIKTGRKKSPKKKPYFSSSSDSECSDDEVQFIGEIQLNKGDPDSPYPNLDLFITGNANADLLKDTRLAKHCHVVMNRIDLSDYEGQLLDEGLLWNRINHLMTKRESSRVETLSATVVGGKVTTQPTYFTTSGSQVHVSLVDDHSSDTEINDKSTSRPDRKHGSLPKKDQRGRDFFSSHSGNETLTIKGIETSSNERANAISNSDEKEACTSIKDGSAIEKDESGKEKGSGNEKGHEDKRDADDSGEGADNKGFYMALLEEFFCEKPRPR